jgi:Ca2+-binding RTX toxin-like protein
MDLDNVETVDVNAKAGADTITVNDLSKTDVNKVNIDLGGADSASDTVVINATNGDDAITITNNNGVVTVSGLATEVTISNFEANNDRIVINGLGGDDVITASGLGTAMLFTANGGDGDDVLIGSAGDDTLTGGAGDDVLIGGPGFDILDGGPGDNILIQSATVAPMGSGSNTGDTVTAADGAHAASLALLGQYMASSFVTAGDGHGGTPLADPASSQQQPLLTQPHA